MSVRRLAELAGVSNPYLSQIERGLRRPSAEILQQLAKALKISVEALYVRAGLLAGRGRRGAERARGHRTRPAPHRRAEAGPAQRVRELRPQLTGRSVRAPGTPDPLSRVQSAVKRVAMISLHTSPLLQPGSGDSGGMNVYVREVASALAQAGIECTTYTRADRAGPATRGGRRAGAPRRPRARRSVRPAEGGAGRRARRVHRRRPRRHPVRARASTSSTATTG